ncbi:hypothetical protein BVX98_05045 [bacterium F11]|nr:hypothetical protein BVX98_05045 [bacterium F11]
MSAILDKSYLAIKKAIKSALPKSQKIKLHEWIVRKRLEKNKLKPHVPPELCFSLTSICNAKCTFCAYTYVDTPKEIMKFDVFKKAIDDYTSLGGQAINLTPLTGEVLVDPHLFEKIGYAKGTEKIKKVGFATNAILLNRFDNYKKIIDANVDWMQISSPGFDDEAYKRVYQTNQYENILAGIKNMLEYKKETKSPIEIFVILRVDRHFEDVVKDEGYKQLLPYIEEKLIEIKMDKEYHLSMDSWCDQITDDKLTGLMFVKPVTTEKPLIPCTRMIWNLSVLPRGDVRVCSCRYYETEYDDMVVGNLKEESLGEILTGKKWQKMLSDIIKENKWPTACKNCSYYGPMGVDQ